MGIFSQFRDFWKRRVLGQKWNKINRNPPKVLLYLLFSEFYKCKKTFFLLYCATLFVTSNKKLRSIIAKSDNASNNQPIGCTSNKKFSIFISICIYTFLYFSSNLLIQKPSATPASIAIAQIIVPKLK